MTSLWCTNQSWTLLSGSFPLRRPPFSRWWEWGANTPLSHTPTPCLLKMYFFYAHAQKEEIDVLRFQYTHLVVNLYNLLAFCFPQPKDSESQAKTLSAAAGSWPSHRVGWGYSAVQPSAPKNKTYPLRKILVISSVVQKMPLFSSDSRPGGWHKWDVNPFLFHQQKRWVLPALRFRGPALMPLHTCILGWVVFYFFSPSPSRHSSLHLSPSLEGCYSFEKA